MQYSSFVNFMKLGTERVEACTRQHFAFALQHRRSMDEMERRTQQARRFYRRRAPRGVSLRRHV